jgi:predicted metalloprotease with PDZ domain
MAIDGLPITIQGELFSVLLGGDREELRQFTIRRKKEQMTLPMWVVRVPDIDEPLGLNLSWDGKDRHFWVSGVMPGSRAERAGIKTTDILVKEGELPLTSWTNYYRALSRQRPHGPLSVEIERHGQITRLSI